MSFLSEMQAFVRQHDAEADAAFDLWTWLPSYKQAEACLGDYASEVEPGADWIMKEACSFIAHGCSPTEEQLAQDPCYCCPCEGMCPKTNNSPSTDSPAMEANHKCPSVRTLPFFETGEEVIKAYGQPRLAKRKTNETVRIREVNGEREIFPHKGGDLTAIPGLDYVMIPKNGAEYPCKIDIFEKSWEEVEPGSGVYRRKALAKLVQIPEGESVILSTKEGLTMQSHPDFIAIGVDDEVYSNSLEWAKGNLDFLVP